jgi:hypothetical protein
VGSHQLSAGYLHRMVLANGFINFRPMPELPALIRTAGVDSTGVYRGLAKPSLGDDIARIICPGRLGSGWIVTNVRDVWIAWAVYSTG